MKRLSSHPLTLKPRASNTSPATAAIGRLSLPYLFPDLSEFATVADLITHLRYRAALPPDFLAKNPSPMYLTLYHLVTRLPDSLRSVRDQFLALSPTDCWCNPTVCIRLVVRVRACVCAWNVSRPFVVGDSVALFHLTPLGAVSTMAGPEERGGRVAGGSGEAQGQGQHRDSAMAPMQPSLGPPRDEPRVFGLDKFNGDNFAEWSFKMENIFDHYDLLEVMEGTEKHPENDPEKSPWVRKSAQDYLLLGQALGSSQIRHIKPFQREPKKGPKAWAALKGVHAPATAAVAVVLERQMAALRIEEDEAVEEGVQKFFDLLTRLEGADLNYRVEWKKAMESELKSIEENGTWELVELPEERKAITSKWLFKIKSDADGKIERYKYRLVAKGYQQKEKVDYKELFAPVVKLTTLRTLLAGAAIKGWVVKQMDVTMAFLNGILEEEIFMAQPEGFDDGSGRVLRLKKALYGLKQTPRQWYLKLRGVLEEIGFTPSTADHSLFMLGEGEQRSFMVVYVDDILIFSPSSDLVKGVMLKLQDKFKCKALGDVSFYLRLHIERDVEKRCMRVHQRKYLEALAANFGQSEGHVATPFPCGFKCVKVPEEESVGEEERRRFHSLVGSLMYAAVNTRPDVAFATGQLARVVQCPNEEQGCSPSPLLPSVASAAAVGYLGAEGVGGASAPSGRRKGGKGKGSRGGGGGRGGGGSGGGGVGGGDGGGGSGAGGE
ncbi:unnamed protein product [Closterium sp. NIES-53]